MPYIPKPSALILVTGSRTYAYPNIVEAAIRSEMESFSNRGMSIRVMHGGADGADSIAEQICRRLGVHTLVVKALWAQHGRSAGPIRNRVMLDFMPSLVLAFHEDLENSKGTKDCVEGALARNIAVFRYDTTMIAKATLFRG